MQVIPSPPYRTSLFPRVSSLRIIRAGKVKLPGVIPLGGGWGKTGNSREKSAVISFKLDARTIKRMERLIRRGHFRNKSDLIRAAIEAKLAKENVV